jgi:hypothetical protein
MDDGLLTLTCAPSLMLPASPNQRSVILRVTPRRIDTHRHRVFHQQRRRGARRITGMMVSRIGNTVPVPALPLQGRRFAPVT